MLDMTMAHRVCSGASRQVDDTHNVVLLDIVRWEKLVPRNRIETVQRVDSNSIHKTSARYRSVIFDSGRTATSVCSTKLCWVAAVVSTRQTYPKDSSVA